MDVPGRTYALGRPRLRLVATILLLALLPLTALHSYLLYHTLVETCYAVVALGVLLMAWTLRPFLRDDFPVFLGVALGAVALLHLLHMLDFPGLGVISGSADRPTQLWLAARLVTGVSMVIASFTIGRRLPMRWVALAYAALDTLVILAVYVWTVFPVAFVPGGGLTTFKKVGEYVVCALFVLAIVLLHRRRRDLPADMLRLLEGALLAGVGAEIFFSFYGGPDEWPNLVGHVFLLLSAVLIYQGVIQDGLARPHAALVASLRDAERLHERLERSLLPKLRLARPDVTLVSVSRPGEQHLELGGDFIDILDRGDDGVAIICGDVSGHGPDAAALGAMLRVSWASLVEDGAQPGDLVAALRAVIARERRNPDTFATLCLARLRPARGEIALLNMGHPQPLLMDHSVASLDVTPLPPLGSVDLPVPAPTVVPLPPGWRIVFYTDGLIEGRAAPGTRERFGEERLEAALARTAGEPLDETRLERLVDGIEAAGGERLADDVSVVVLSAADRG